MIGHCWQANSRTIEACFTHSLVGRPNHSGEIERQPINSLVLLHNTSTKLVHGPFFSTHNGFYPSPSRAPWGGKYMHQVSFRRAPGAPHRGFAVPVKDLRRVLGRRGNINFLSAQETAKVRIELFSSAAAATLPPQRFARTIEHVCPRCKVGSRQSKGRGGRRRGRCEKCRRDHPIEPSGGTVISERKRSRSISVQPSPQTGRSRSSGRSRSKSSGRRRSRSRGRRVKRRRRGGSRSRSRGVFSRRGDPAAPPPLSAFSFNSSSAAAASKGAFTLSANYNAAGVDFAVTGVTHSTAEALARRSEACRGIARAKSVVRFESESEESEEEGGGRRGGRGGRGRSRRVTPATGSGMMDRSSSPARRRRSTSGGRSASRGSRGPRSHSARARSRSKTVPPPPVAAVERVRGIRAELNQSIGSPISWLACYKYYFNELIEWDLRDEGNTCASHEITGTVQYHFSTTRRGNTEVVVRGNGPNDETSHAARCAAMSTGCKVWYEWGGDGTKPERAGKDLDGRIPHCSQCLRRAPCGGCGFRCVSMISHCYTHARSRGGL